MSRVGERELSVASYSTTCVSLRFLLLLSRRLQRAFPIMEERESLVGLRGLYQDLSALSDSSLVNIDRLRVELETHIDDFRKLLDKPAKNNASRQAVMSGKLDKC